MTLPERLCDCLALVVCSRVWQCKTSDGMYILATGKYGCRKVRVYPAECGKQLGRDPSKNGISKSLVLKSFSGEGTLWDSSLPALWDTPVLCTPPLPHSQIYHDRLSAWLVWYPTQKALSSPCVSVAMPALQSLVVNRLCFEIWLKFASGKL